LAHAAHPLCLALLRMLQSRRFLKNAGRMRLTDAGRPPGARPAGVPPVVAESAAEGGVAAGHHHSAVTGDCCGRHERMLDVV